MAKKLFSTTNLVILALIIGLGSGFYANYSLTTPRIEGLTSDLAQKTSQVGSLQDELIAVRANYTETLSGLMILTQQYEDLSSNSVSLSEYQELQDSYDEASNEIETLQSVNQAIVNENRELSLEYLRLMEKYNELRVLPWTYFIVNNLKVNLTVTSNTYASNVVPVEGTISIKYLDGRPFNGQVKLMVWSDFYRSGKQSPTLTVPGYTGYSMESAFIHGPGKYFILVSIIEDLSGADVATYNDLLNYRISLQMG